MSQLTAGPIDEHEPEDVQVEVEQLTDESQEVNDTGSLVAQSVVHHVNADYHAINGPTTGSPSPSQRAPGKRTIILPPQRQILEDFYRTGMTSAGQHLHHLHQAAVDRTGLDISVVKNWIRNRRRPPATVAQVKMDGVQPIPQQAFQTTTIAALSAVPMPPITTVTIPRITHTHPSFHIPEGKRICFENGSSNGTAHATPFVVKVRIADSGESDFVEVEMEGLTFIMLLQACCEELGVGLSDVAKLRKLPNILLRKDRDVQRLKQGQELELVLKNPHPPPAFLGINPFTTATTSTAVQLLNVNPLIGRDGDADGPGIEITSNSTSSLA